MWQSKKKRLQAKTATGRLHKNFRGIQHLLTLLQILQVQQHLILSLLIRYFTSFFNSRLVVCLAFVVICIMCRIQRLALGVYVYH